MSIRVLSPSAYRQAVFAFGEFIMIIVNKEKENCGDCNAEFGEPHHEKCDMARCLKCGYQRLSCECKENSFYAEDDWIIMSDFYDIAKARIENTGDIVKWVVHLSQKNWITRKHIQFFVEEASKHIKFNCYGCG